MDWALVSVQPRPAGVWPPSSGLGIEVNHRAAVARHVFEGARSQALVLRVTDDFAKTVHAVRFALVIGARHTGQGRQLVEGLQGCRADLEIKRTHLGTIILCAADRTALVVHVPNLACRAAQGAHVIRLLSNRRKVCTRYKRMKRSAI